MNNTGHPRDSPVRPGRANAIERGTFRQPTPNDEGVIARLARAIPWKTVRLDSLGIPRSYAGE
ncbi:MAG TPA: hypothetical protein VK508_19305 [Cyclobacteriaceae bacterium]|nr:hypothetical protein [Cyclobacteriaceae bacterium]